MQLRQTVTSGVQGTHRGAGKGSLVREREKGRARKMRRRLQLWPSQTLRPVLASGRRVPRLRLPSTHQRRRLLVIFPSCDSSRCMMREIPYAPSLSPSLFLTSFFPFLLPLTPSRLLLTASLLPSSPPPDALPSTAAAAAAAGVKGGAFFPSFLPVSRCHPLEPEPRALSPFAVSLAAACMLSGCRRGTCACI